MVCSGRDLVSRMRCIHVQQLQHVPSGSGLRTGLNLYAGAEPIAVPELHGYDHRYHAFETWTGLAYLGELLAACMFIPWFAMAYGNLRRLGVQHLRWSNGWAVGSWFVPILGLVRPKQIANDIWRGSEAGAHAGSERWKLLPVSPILHWWWAFFLIGGFAGFAVGVAMVDAAYRHLVEAVRLGQDWGPSLAEVRTGALISVLGSVCLLAAAVLGAMFVYRATQRFEAIRRQLILTTPAQAPARALPDAAPLQDLVTCPECAEFVLPFGACGYCGYNFAGPANL